MAIAISDPIVFTSNYQVIIRGLEMEPEEVLARCGPLEYPILAINSNNGCMSAPNFEYLRKDLKNTDTSTKKNGRKKIGDGFCMGSALEISICIPYTYKEMYGDRFNYNKIYETKCFPQTGKLQINGVTDLEYMDGIIVAYHLVMFLKSRFGSGITSLPSERYVSMSNYRSIILGMEGKSINMNNLIKIALAHTALYKIKSAALAETRSPRLTMQFINKRKPKGHVSVGIFRSGKINFLGVGQIEDCYEIIGILKEILNEYKNKIIINIPTPDNNDEE